MNVFEYTCPYCGSEMSLENQDFYCAFCVMDVAPSDVKRNHERISVRVKEFVSESYLDKTTPELMEISTYELLSLLKSVRAERTSMYQLMNAFYKARVTLSTTDYEDSEKSSGEEYERITRKMFVLENIIRERLGYVPGRLTDHYLFNYLASIKKIKISL
ncbi:hypothetical protein [Jeotgalibacillus terrae]|uniref:Viral late gene transcription factor 3 zinc ribbon domain-containing protein n=1 Tax=Jeotgalibacillus terrae TaxID=587735 RepID=A0ABW5ZK42_9BACL|nr:hypothetical protein [Jeotgalibacillus terrae]MBM7580816.1 hypothetical protein [Jeotgalibacillus terrae]